jgi:uncharacterized protein
MSDCERRVLLVSDTHGALDDLILQAAATVDLIIHAGDLGSASVLEALEACAPVVAVRGNNDSEEKVGLDWRVLRRLPLRACVPLPGGTLAVEHGDRCRQGRTRHADLRRHWPHARAVVYGHSHRMAVDTEAEPWVLNPGAAGRTRTGGGPSCLILTAMEDRWMLEPLRRVRGEGPLRAVAVPEPRYMACEGSISPASQRAC